MERTAAAITLGLALGGCASGTILSGQSGPATGAATLSAPPGAVLHVAPLHRPRDSISIDRHKDLKLFVTSGWYKIAYSCDARYEKGEVVAVLMREYTTERNLRVRAGHIYRLECSQTQMGVIHIRDLGLAPNNSLKPTPLRSGNRHDRKSLPCLSPPLRGAA